MEQKDGLITVPVPGIIEQIRDPGAEVFLVPAGARPGTKFTLHPAVPPSS